MYTATNIATPEAIHALCSDIQVFIEEHYNADNGHAVVERSQKLEGYMAVSGKMLADAKYHLDNAVNSVFMDAIKKANQDKMAATVMKRYLDALCKDYNYLVTWCDRINRACTHQLEFSRTIISKLKAESYNRL